MDVAGGLPGTKPFVGIAGLWKQAACAANQRLFADTR